MSEREQIKTSKVTAEYTLPQSKIVLDRKHLATFNNRLQKKLLELLYAKGYRFLSRVYPQLSMKNDGETPTEVTFTSFHIELAGRSAELPPTDTLEAALKEAIRIATTSVRATAKRVNDSAHSASE